MRGIFEAAAVQRDQALISAHVLALIDGHAQMALAEQLAGTEPVLQARSIEARIGAQPIGRLEVDDQKRYRAVGLGLQQETAVEFQRRSQQRRQHDRFAEQLAHRRGIIVLVQDLVERGAKPSQTSTQIQRVDLERQHRVIDRNR